ncbi:sensor histidine kinase [Rhodohalobacter mucosus]|uniref:histidine kinase n=1 Tax=Rhodohalobacter mucosus TaxID=2079485 RepID=A0A316U3R2_9BACT|nr:HAMP domain-containing sensor histidine kinase [Rhodohalobacter mucosus]PWN08126.1 sensor histidine kinase [Rhodohalobacter mucosus]
MEFLKSYHRQNRLRWIFLGIGIVAVLALTTLNVYSLYALRQSTIDSAKDNKKNQLEEFTDQVRNRFSSPFMNLVKLNTEQLQNTWNASSNFPRRYNKVLSEALSDSLFTSIHFIPQNINACHDDSAPVYKFDSESEVFLPENENNIPQIVCDGFSLAVSRTQVALNEYKWNNRVTFDAHRSMTVSLINLKEKSVVGHINLVIDRDYMVNDYFERELRKQFGTADESGVVVWLRDWMQDEILTSSDHRYVYNRDVYEIDFRQGFPNLLDNWVLHATFLESPTVAASNASLTRNLIVLGFAVFALFGALVFMFINAQRERELAQRQAGFLANITHELKTPLAVMQAAGENISDGRVTDGNRLRTYGDHIYEEAIRLRKMIEKLLDVARVDAGQNVVELAPFQLDEIAENVYRSSKDFVESKGFRFEINTGGKVPFVMVDADHVETILKNLIENAVKYSSDEKYILIDVRNLNGSVAVSVTDKGDGIPKKSQKLIFEKFYRVEGDLTVKTKGHGLGLAIVKNLVEMNGGNISLESTPVKGSTFTITFPVLVQEMGSSEAAKRTGAAEKLNREEEYVG